MGVSPLGLHHVTAIADDPQGNVDFYLTVLGLRLIKQTVNFDDPSAYHLYYGDDIGAPSTIMTFFAWPGAPKGRRGAGQASTTAFSVPEGSLGWWKDRLESAGVTVPGAGSRLEEDVLTFFDPDGLALELVAHAGTDERPPWERGPVPGRHAIRGLYSVTLTEDDFDTTAGMLTGTLGFRPVEEAGGRSRFEVGAGGAGARLDVVAQPGMGRGQVAVGTVHHVAWRAPDEATQLSWQSRSSRRGPRSPPSSTGSTSARSTSASPAACCSRWLPTAPGSPSTSPPISSG